MATLGGARRRRGNRENRENHLPSLYARRLITFSPLSYIARAPHYACFFGGVAWRQRQHRWQSTSTLYMQPSRMAITSLCIKSSSRPRHHQGAHHGSSVAKLTSSSRRLACPSAICPTRGSIIGLAPSIMAWPRSPLAKSAAPTLRRRSLKHGKSGTSHSAASFHSFPFYLFIWPLAIANGLASGHSATTRMAARRYRQSSSRLSVPRDDGRSWRLLNCHASALPAA